MNFFRRPLNIPSTIDEVSENEENSDRSKRLLIPNRGSASSSATKTACKENVTSPDRRVEHRGKHVNAKSVARAPAPADEKYNRYPSRTDLFVADVPPPEGGNWSSESEDDGSEVRLVKNDTLKADARVRRNLYKGRDLCMRAYMRNLRRMHKVF